MRGRSDELLRRAERLVPSCSQTLSKSPSQWVRGFAPGFVERARGAYVWDVDGNRYIDLPMALGPILLGHADAGVQRAVVAQLEHGVVYTLPHPIELEVAETIVGRVPGAEMVRFGKTGSEANSAAIRLARFLTGRDHVVVAGYHGWHDWFIGATSRHAGVPSAVRELTDAFSFNDIASLERVLATQNGDTAAVILEPAGVEEANPGFLESVVARAHAAGALVIFDEVITGFRLAPGGAQERYGVNADLVTFGKALGNGMPISAVTGRSELMRGFEEVFFSMTHGGETLSLAAAREVLRRLGPAQYDELWTKGEQLHKEVSAAIARAGVEEWVSIGGAAPRTVVLVKEPGDPARLVAKALVQQELLRRGVLFNGSNFVSLALSTDDIDHVVDAYEAAFVTLARGLPDDLEQLLEGEPLAPAFRSA